MVEFYHKVQDMEPVRYLTMEYYFNSNDDIYMEDEDGTALTFDAYMTAMEDCLEKDSEEYQKVYQFTKLWCFRDVYIN